MSYTSGVATLFSYSHLFPAPAFVVPRIVGVSCSDETLRFMRLEEKKHGLLPEYFGEVSIPQGCISDGVVADKRAFVLFLRGVRKTHKLTHARFALPSSAVYSFTVALPKHTVAIRRVVESLVPQYAPLKKADAIVDYVVLPDRDHDDMLVQVAAVDKKISQAYFDCFAAAGIVPVQFEVEAQSVTRALLPIDHSKVTMIVSIGKQSTVVAIASDGVLVYSTSIPWGGVGMSHDVAAQCVISSNETQRLLRTVGFASSQDHRALFSALADATAMLQKTVKDFYLEWNTQKIRKEIFPNISNIMLTGEYSIIPGFAEYLTAQLAIPVEQGNPWGQCVSFAAAVPEIPFDQAVKYTTVIGLSLIDHLYD